MIVGIVASERIENAIADSLDLKIMIIGKQKKVTVANLGQIGIRVGRF